MEKIEISQQAVRAKVEELARMCNIAKNRQHDFVEDVLANISRYKMQTLQSSLKQKRKGNR